MVTIDEKDGSTEIVLAPNRSLEWQQLLPWLLILSFPCALVAIAWFFLGVWAILPFAGLELSILALVMLRVCYLNHRQQRITVDDDSISVSMGIHLPFNERHFPRELCRQIIRKSESQMLELYLRCRGKDIELGSFLTDEEKEGLSQTLLKLRIVKQFERLAVMRG